MTKILRVYILLTLGVRILKSRSCFIFPRARAAEINRVPNSPISTSGAEDGAAPQRICIPIHIYIGDVS